MMVENGCAYHPDVPVPTKFSVCWKCARDFFIRRDLYSPLFNSEEIIEVSMEDIIVETDDMKGN
jgi:hypothetical protein